MGGREANEAGTPGGRERIVQRNSLGHVGRGQRPSGDGEEKPEDKGVHCVALRAPFTAL